MIFKDYFDSVYSARVLFFANCTIAEANIKLIKKYGISTEQLLEPNAIGASGGVWVVDSKKEGICYCIWVDNIKVSYVLAHESFHLVFEIFDHRGITINYDNQESAAYYIGFWMQLFMELKK